MQSLIGHHYGGEESMNIIILQSYIIYFKWLCKAVMTLGVDLLFKMTKVVTIMVTRQPCIPVVRLIISQANDTHSLMHVHIFLRY